MFLIHLLDTMLVESWGCDEALTELEFSVVVDAAEVR